MSPRIPMTALLFAAGFLAAALLSGCGEEKPTPEACTAAHIKEMADKDGLDKAKALSKACLEKGYDDAMAGINAAGNALKEKLFGEGEPKKP